MEQLLYTALAIAGTIWFINKPLHAIIQKLERQEEQDNGDQNNIIG